MHLDSRALGYGSLLPSTTRAERREWVVLLCIAGVVPVMCNAMHNWLVGAALSSVQRMCMDDPRRIAGAAAAIRDQKKERTTNHGKAARKSACCAWCVKGNMSRERSEMTGVKRLCTSLRHLLEPFELRTAPCNPHPASRGLSCQCRLAQHQDEAAAIQGMGGLHQKHTNPMLLQAQVSERAAMERDSIAPRATSH